MIEYKVYWTFIVSIISCFWVLLLFIRDLKKQVIERTNGTINRFLESDKFLIENPEVQMFFIEHHRADPDEFREETWLTDKRFIRAKTHAYMVLNCFDELLSVSSSVKKRAIPFLMPNLIEQEDWEAYIRVKMSHPLFRCILVHEAPIFGSTLVKFWKKEQKTIESMTVDPFVW